MKYFFNYFSIGFIVVMAFLSWLNLTIRYRKAKAAPKKKKKSGIERNRYIVAHKAMAKDLKRYKEELSDAEDDTEREKIERNKPVATRSVVTYWDSL